MKYEEPCLKSKWKYAHLMSDSYEHIVIDGLEMTAKNIWEHKGPREVLVEKLVDYFYNEGFKPFIELSDKEIEDEIVKLVKADANSVLDSDGSIKNTSRLGLSICRDFCQKSFYATRVNGTPSIYDVYKDKDLLRKVLKNRLGWYTTTEPLKLEDGTILEGEHPYLFDISHKMVVQGCHSAMVSANVSNFRPLVAKFLMQKFCSKYGKVLDLSAGWGARFLAAFSLGLDYYGIDPMTTKELIDFYSFISLRKCQLNPELAQIEKTQNTVWQTTFSENGSEVEDAYISFPDDIDYAIVCPPYFKLEEYICEENSTNVYPNYNDWLDKYWRKTVQNAKSKMKDGAKFTLIMIEKWEKFNLLDDMSKIIEQEGFKKIDEMSYKTARSHLTNKRKSKKINKDTEKIWTFEKV